MKDLESLSASQAIKALSQREIKATDLLLSCLDRIGQRESHIKAWTSLGKENALSRAKELDKGAFKGILHGLPIGVKDLYDTYDLPTSYGSPIYANHYPVADAVSIALIRQAGGIILGKTVTTELASFKSGLTTNPHNSRHTPGGSSSGSAAAVADFMVPLATGSQTAGSMIRPASYCGVVGFKPSLGKVSIAGVKSLSVSLDTLGCFGRTVEDVGLGVAAMSGDHRLAKIEMLHNKPRIAICKTSNWSLAQQETATAMAVARHAAERIAKSTVVDLKLPKSCDDITQAQTRIMLSEMSRSFVFERTHYPKKLSLILSKQLTDGAAISYEQYAKDLLFAGNAKLSINALFNDEVDLLIAPSAPGEAPDLKDGTGDPVFCREWTLLGLPCININVASGPNGLPVGVQLIAGPDKDHFLLSAARAFVHALPDPTLRDQA
ncbi:amidase [Polynucleobacter sp. AP-Capit-er-40B-B4]|uniref:amidase n=1 Tax=Polynucleobacter sp. AP-Capit-er-40B-B4 TaxID=2576927 RepID=UPI001C0E7026|nr:amidase [Polynucleobacter sp. AP-Capit-er-40B-B4]MBU3582083.1 amidase [Polynucleobacter sp. AP-Capit-er-40B-B4]